MRQHVPERDVRFTEANGLRHAYFEEGEGPLALLLHGFPDTAHTWDVVRPGLARLGFRVVSPFLRGYAPTGIPDRDSNTRILAQDALGLIEALGERQAVVVGHDWGAETAQACADLAPERVSKLVMIAIPHRRSIRRTPRLVWTLRHFIALKAPGAVERFAENDFSAVEVLYRRWSPTWHFEPAELESVKNAFAASGCLNAALGYYRAAATLGTPEWLKGRVSVPTLAVAGADDPGITVQAFEDARRFFTRGYRVVAIPGGHFCHREAPEPFLAALEAFLKT